MHSCMQKRKLSIIFKRIGRAGIPGVKILLKMLTHGIKLNKRTNLLTALFGKEYLMEVKNFEAYLRLGMLKEQI